MKVYNFERLKNELWRLAERFPQMEWGSIGQSLWGREIFYVRLGRGENVISYNGAHHGMEWITSAMLMRFAEEYLEAEEKKKFLSGFSVEALSKKTSLYIIPMVNPDGVDLATGGVPNWLSEQSRRELFVFNGQSEDFGNWQANGRGVDLNHNYDAMWEKSKEMEKEYGVFGPGATRFSGDKPFSEPESQALARFTAEKDFRLVIAFHSQGKVIYQGFEGKEPALALKIAKAFERISPYRLDFAEGIASVGGYKDWFVKEFGRSGFTIEVGEGRNPLPFENLPIIYNETLPILLGAMTIG